MAMDAQNFQRREGRRDDRHRHHHHHPPTTTTTPLPTSTGDHASHLHHQNPTPALPTAGDRDRHHHRLLAVRRCYLRRTMWIVYAWSSSLGM
ncbi:hypothetical protein RHGRI_001221 [Rhododendron griersonianum]|uniref:Phytochrome B n=1 Tax=Rhododendron griersonianum TaxID=479676 RepID=A0AAV6LFW0_9ERIC|nr:hypothetical protein RHGRI_005621 [Rhododendron griersonianum]KAG5565257.1 hypothetical protein RHGRI_001221 [Rhododendron griersonianum]